ncbi:hypothetical protein EVAR_11711_1 [Eumeta japonica]|uniref:Uncharacterized protein n=1 Tax=Eumeta variegata TaxID=151549 RepID=A0A4C1U4J6_EUMVA|nr:hypothetical protein EVAR_11711_1 [Eumeta japonica]
MLNAGKSTNEFSNKSIKKKTVPSVPRRHSKSPLFVSNLIWLHIKLPGRVPGSRRARSGGGRRASAAKHKRDPLEHFTCEQLQTSTGVPEVLAVRACGSPADRCAPVKAQRTLTSRIQERVARFDVCRKICKALAMSLKAFVSSPRPEFIDFIFEVGTQSLTCCSPPASCSGSCLIPVAGRPEAMHGLSISGARLAP